MTKKLILIDANALIHRAFHALPLLRAPDGSFTNAVYGFTSILLKVMRETNPDYIAACFDVPAPTKRHEMFKEYKGHREKAPNELYAQMPLVKELLEYFGIPIYEKKGYEADDLLGVIAKKTEKAKNLQTIILTGDLDTLQLIKDNKVVVCTLKKGVSETMVYGEKEVVERFGFLPKYVPDFKGLKGDPSDNIPGVPGIGDKTASSLVQEFGTLENLFDAVEKGTGKELETKFKSLNKKLVERLREHKNIALFSKKLAIIITDIDIPFSLKETEWKKRSHPEKALEKMQELGFASLTKRLPNTMREAHYPHHQEQNNIQDQAMQMIRTKNEFSKLVEILEGKKEFYFSLEKEDAVLISYDRNRAFRISLKNESMRSAILRLFQSTSIKKIGFDLKHAYKIFSNKFKTPIHRLFFDIKIAAWLLNSETKDQSFEQLYLMETGKPIDRELDKSSMYGFHLYELLWDKLKAENLLAVLEDIDMPLIPILASMEMNGIKVNTDSLESLSQIINGKISLLEKKIHKVAHHSFNINSPQQLSEILFERLSIKTIHIKKTSGGALSTAASELEKIVGEHPIIPLILDYRELQKLKTTYVDPLPGFIGKDGRIHTTLNQTGTTTGRLSSQDPNLQNIPIRTDWGQEFRKVFVAPKDRLLLSLDYSQIDLRLAAHIAHDEKMIQAFKEGEDIHLRTAAEVFDVRPDRVTPSMRRQAKELNFGIIYGMGIVGFARASGVSRERAREFIEKYKDEFSGIARYIEKTKVYVHEYGYTKTLFGRKRSFPDVHSKMPQLVAQAERMAINMPVQGSSADIMKLAMIHLDAYIKKHYVKKEVLPLLQIHDEILFEVKKNLIKKIAREFKEIMERAHKLAVPLIVDAKYGHNWKTMKKL